MNILPKNTYSLKVKDGNLQERIETLKNNTLEGNPYIMQSTSKSFIGSIGPKELKIISAQLPFGLAVVMKGEMFSDNIKLTMVLHPLLKGFIYVFSLLILASSLLGMMRSFELGMLITPFVFLVILRFAFIGAAYNMGKKLALSKLSLIFDVKAEVTNN